MSIKSSSLILFLNFISLCVGLDLPPYFKKCSKSDPNISECIFKNINSSYETFSKGDEKYHLHLLDPLSIPYMHVKVDNNLYGNLTNGNVYGLKNSIFKEVKADLSKQTFEFLYLVPLCTVAGDAELFGKLLTLSIGGTGKGNVTFTNSLQRFYFHYELKEKKGKQYMVIRNCSAETVELEKALFQAEFYGSEFGNALNKVLNENWRELKDYISESVNMAFGEIYKDLLNLFFAKIPFEKFFDD